jgi:methionyl-tRNA synthetase
LNDEQPWTLFKQEKKAEGAGVLLTSLELLKFACVLLSPFTPRLSQKIWHQLGYDSDLTKVKLAEKTVRDQIPAGQALRNEGPVFLRIELDPAKNGAVAGR